MPALGATLLWTAQQIFPSMLGLSDTSDEPLSQTTGFVGADGSAVRGAKKKKSQTRKEDEKALTHLKRVGDVTRAKYRFLSNDFMKRHGIGQFADEMAMRESIKLAKPRPYSRSTTQKRREEDSEPESDAEWIVSALTQDGKEDGNDISTDPHSKVRSRITTPAITVGFEIGGTGRTGRRKRTTISDVTRLTSVTEKRKLNGPRVSDRESGVMGRIRAAGANSLVGRNLLGAYPGDAPPPDEAASPNGLFELAEKYGYGEWSDVDDDLLPEPREAQDGQGRPSRKQWTVFTIRPRNQRNDVEHLHISKLTLSWGGSRHPYQRVQ